MTRLFYDCGEKSAMLALLVQAMLEKVPVALDEYTGLVAISA
jgi:hypothetical protein